MAKSTQVGVRRKQDTFSVDKHRKRFPSKMVEERRAAEKQPSLQRLESRRHQDTCTC